MEHNPAAGAEDRGRVLARPLWDRSLGAGGVEADLNLETSQGSPAIKLWEFSLHTVACFCGVLLGSFMIL